MATTIHFEFKDFLKLLKQKHVEYLVVGGCAVSYHGDVRPTADFVSRSSPQLKMQKKFFRF